MILGDAPVDSAGFEAVRDQLLSLQDEICRGLEGIDGAAFSEQRFGGPDGALHRPRVLSNGEIIEKAAVHFSSSAGKNLPAAATERRPELAGLRYRAVSVSLIVHPRNPMAPTSHANFRFFVAGDGSEAAWWFGGGFDLTPFYGFVEDCESWHRKAAEACAPFGAETHARFKQGCDDYFQLPHRQEPRGIGGVFYDDLDQPDFPTCFALHRALGATYLEAYAPILRARSGMAYGEREREWQLLRRGRYVEFNLLQDRGTRFGLEAAGRVESILASLPPLVRWEYDHQPEPGSAEAQLLEEFLVPRDWLGSS
jgi:coproporphyrinogen III oxidase